MTSATNAEGLTPCLVHSECAFCDTADAAGECDAARDDLVATAFDYQIGWTYGATIEYHCPPGMDFVDPAVPDFAPLPTQTMACGWDEEWSPAGILQCARK